MTSPWHASRALVFVGTGGVGKTTAAAAMAIASAARGVPTLVMTVDPARRLATALGLDSVGIEIEVSAERMAAHGVALQAPLWALIPDVRRIFDGLLERLASAEKRANLRQNRIYQHVAGALAGSHEFATMEKLYEIQASGRYGCIVLDTPPAQNVADFLEAPTRVMDFLENETLQWLLHPYAAVGHRSLRLANLGGSLLLRTISKLTGAETLRELANFVLTFDSLLDGFRNRAQGVKEFLTAQDTAFVLVTSAVPAQQRAASRFLQDLTQLGIEVRAAVVNRMQAPPPSQTELECFARWLDDSLGAWGPDSLAEVQGLLAEECGLAARQQLVLAQWRRRLPGLPMVLLPEQPTDVHDLAGLATLAKVIRADDTVSS